MKNKQLIQILVLAVLIPHANSLAQDSSFVLSTDKIQKYYPAYIGNGHFSISSSQLGTLPAESYSIKFYDKGKNDIPRIAALPEWNEINYFNGHGRLNDVEFNSAAIQKYNQTLNTKNGVLSTSYVWKDSLNRETKIQVTNFISRSNKNLAVIKFEFTPDFSGEVKLVFPLKERKKPQRTDLAVLKTIDFPSPDEWPYFWYPGFTNVTSINAHKYKAGARISVKAQSEGKKTKIVLASEIFCDNDKLNPQINIYKTSNSASAEFIIKTNTGSKYTFYKLVSIVPEFESKNDLVEEAENILNGSRQKGYEKLYGDNKREWEDLWKTDIVIEGDNELQKIVHSMMFYLLCSADANTDFGLPAMGLSTAGYFGHVFWDSDIYMMPPLLLMHPAIAKSLVKFRYHTLESAVENAKTNNYKGAMYPWESDEEGNETTPFFAIQNAVKENHISGDVAFAQWQYFCATKDTNYLRKFGAEIIRKTADFWVSRAVYNIDRNLYEIHNVVSVSESEKDVNNETYTNAIAKINLELAVKVSAMLNIPRNPDWKKVGEKMLIPFNAEKEFHPLYENAGAGQGASKFWSSVVNLLDYPLQMKMSDNTKRNDLMHAVKSLEVHGAGAMMGINFLSIIAAELGSDSLQNYTIDKTLRGYLKPPFNVLSETHTNEHVNFLTGAGSFLQQVIFGYTGLRITEDGIVEKYKPMLPQKVKKLTLKNFTINNSNCDIIIQDGKLEKIIR